MKKVLFIVSVISAITFSACNSGGSKNEHEGHDTDNMNKGTVAPATAGGKEVKTVAVTFTNLDPMAAAAMKEIVGHYLHIKNALVSGDAGGAANGGKALGQVLNRLDKSLLTAPQKAVYDRDEEELKEHAEHIARNGDNIIHQRSHFSMMSEVMYSLVKAFGAGRPVYHDHCPMYNENKGAMWLSEAKEVKNPYYGSEMLTCGSVEEIIQ